MADDEHDEEFAAVVRRHGGQMLRAARRLLGGDEEAARDAVQDAFLSAHRARQGFRADARLSTWLYRIVVNAALMRRRAGRRRREVPIDDLLPRFEADGHFCSPPPSPEQLLAAAQERTAVRAAIDRLPAAYRTVLVLRDLEELSTEEAADVLGVTRNTVKVRLHRARQALLMLLQPGEAARAGARQAIRRSRQSGVAAPAAAGRAAGGAAISRVTMRA